MDHAADPHLASRACHAPREQGRGSGQEAAVAHPCPVDMGMRADQDIITDDRGWRARPRITAFSITMLRAPTLTCPSSAVSTAPNRTRAPGPMRTAPHKTAVGAT